MCDTRNRNALKNVNLTEMNFNAAELKLQMNQSTKTVSFVLVLSFGEFLTHMRKVHVLNGFYRCAQIFYIFSQVITI